MYISTGVLVDKTVAGLTAAGMPALDDSETPYTVTFDLYANYTGDGTDVPVAQPAVVTIDEGKVSGTAQFMDLASTLGNPIPFKPDYKSDTPVTYTVVEHININSTIPGYTCTDTTSAEDSTHKSGGTMLTFETDSGSPVYTAHFTNTYKLDTVDFTFTKVGVGDDTNGLGGVDFTLQPDSDSPDTLTAVSDADGQVIFPGLTAGDYILTETKAATGYALPQGQWEITVDPTATEPITITAIGAPTAFSITTDDNGKTTYTLHNYLQLILPATGRLGSLAFTIAGVMLIGLGGLAAVAIEDKKAKRRRC